MASGQIIVQKQKRIEELLYKLKEEGALTGLDFLEYVFLVKTYWE